MKKTILFTAALFAFSAVSAQTGEITSNRGENWLSQDGDWALTFEATPLLNYAGNLFNGNMNNGGVALNNLIDTRGYGNGVVIGGKKLIDANTAYRGQMRIGFGSQKETDQVPSVADANSMVDNVTKNNFMGIDLGVGLEKRVGSTRVVGVYGAMFDIGFGSAKSTYEYGNALSNNNPGSRTTEEKDQSLFGLGLRAFAGIEWFCAPKISLSGEYTWGIAMSSKGFNETTTESWDFASGGSVVTETTEGGTKTSNFSIDTGISGASIGLNFYFQ